MQSIPETPLKGNNSTDFSPDSAKPIRAMLDVMGGDRDASGHLTDRIKPSRFGKGRGRILRKAVLLAIAKNCQPDGSGAFPAVEAIAHRCLVSRRAVLKVIQWLKKHRLLRVEKRAVRVGQFSHLNRYQILFDAPRKVRKPKAERGEIEVHNAPDSEVNGRTQRGELKTERGEHYAERGEIENDTITPSLERLTERRSERPVAHLSSEAKPPTKKKNPPENGQELIDLCAELQKLGDVSFTGKYRAEIGRMAQDWGTQEIIAAYKGFIENRDDFQMKRAVQEFCEGGAIDRLTNLRKESEQRKRQDESVRIQQEQSRRKMEEAEKQRAKQDAQAIQQAQELLAMLPEAGPVEVTA